MRWWEWLIVGAAWTLLGLAASFTLWFSLSIKSGVFQ